MGKTAREEKALMHLVKLNTEPPRLTGHMIEMSQQLTRDIPHLHAYVSKICVEKNHVELFDTAKLLWDAIQTILRTSAFNVAEMWTAVPMQREPAWTLLMCVFSNNAALVTIWRSCCDCMELALPNAWDCKSPATKDKYLLMKGLCVSDSAIEKYTTTILLDAIALLATYWHRLDPCERLVNYVLRLYHRACIIVAQPGTDRVHDDEDFRKDIGQSKKGNKMHSANSRLLRTLSGQLTRMLGNLYFVTERESTWARVLLRSKTKGRGGIDIEDFVPRYRQFMRGRAALVANVGDGRAFVSKHFYRLAVTFGDIEEFMEQRDTEVPDPQSVMMITKSPEAQQAWSKLAQTIMLEKIPDVMHEEDEDYFERFAYAQHIYCLILKMYIFDLSLKNYGFSVRTKHLIWEIDLPSKIPMLLMESGPFFVHMFGSINIVHQGKIYRCRCTEEAIATWSFIVVHVYSGRIDNCDIHEPLREILYQETTDMAHKRAEDTHIVMDGEIEGE